MTEEERNDQCNFICAIIKEAEEFRKTHVPTWWDYEHYKQLLQDRGIYGFEGEVANALHL